MRAGETRPYELRPGFYEVVYRSSTTLGPDNEGWRTAGTLVYTGHTMTDQSTHVMVQTIGGEPREVRRFGEMREHRVRVNHVERTVRHPRRRKGID